MAGRKQSEDRADRLASTLLVEVSDSTRQPAGGEEYVLSDTSGVVTMAPAGDSPTSGALLARKVDENGREVTRVRVKVDPVGTCCQPEKVLSSMFQLLSIFDFTTAPLAVRYPSRQVMLRGVATT